MESGTASDDSPQEADKPVERKEEGQDEEEDSTRDQIKKLLNIPKVQPKPPKPERRRKPKRRRSPSSRSRTADRESRQDTTEKNASFISPSKIADIFKGTLSSKNLCELSAMKCGSPTAIRKIMPDASVDQICRMVTL